MKNHCQSCGMEIEEGKTYCHYCSDGEGNLTATKKEVIKATAGFMIQQGMGEDEAMKKATEQVSQLPAWQ